jgi:hypothetical protein
MFKNNVLRKYFIFLIGFSYLFQICPCMTTMLPLQHRSSYLKKYNIEAEVIVLLEGGFLFPYK